MASYVSSNNLTEAGHSREATEMAEVMKEKEDENERVWLAWSRRNK